MIREDVGTGRDYKQAATDAFDADGNLSYLNATLAEWLDHDLAQIVLEPAPVDLHRGAQEVSARNALWSTVGFVSVAAR